MRILAGGDVSRDFRYDIREIAAALDSKRDAYITQLYEKSTYSRGMDGTLRGDYASEVISTIPTADAYGRFFVPIKEVLLLPNDDGYYAVFYRQTTPTLKIIPIIPVRAESGLFESLKSNRLQGFVGFYPQKDNNGILKIYFSGNTSVLAVGTQIICKLVLKGSEIAMNEIYPMPTSSEDEIINAVIQQFVGAMNIPKDKIPQSE